MMMRRVQFVKKEKRIILYSTNTWEKIKQWALKGITTTTQHGAEKNNTSPHISETDDICSGVSKEKI